MFSAIKSFAKRNRVLFILLIVAVSITLSYYISYDIPELISGIEKWYKLFSDLSIGVIINFRSIYRDVKKRRRLCESLILI